MSGTRHEVVARPVEPGRGHDVERIGSEPWAEAGFVVLRRPPPRSIEAVACGGHARASRRGRGRCTGLHIGKRSLRRLWWPLILAARPELAHPVVVRSAAARHPGPRSRTPSSISRCSTTTWRRSPRRVTRSRARSDTKSATRPKDESATKVKDFETERPAFSNDHLVQQLLDSGVKVSAEPGVDRLVVDAIVSSPSCRRC